jgi:hypothetical protein
VRWGAASMALEYRTVATRGLSREAMLVTVAGKRSPHLTLALSAPNRGQRGDVITNRTPALAPTYPFPFFRKDRRCLWNP